MCAHSQNPMSLRLMTYTRYGAMVGCLVCGKSWLVTDPKRTSAPLADSSRSQ
jgi:hypothetical protein